MHLRDVLFINIALLKLKTWLKTWLTSTAVLVHSCIHVANLPDHTTSILRKTSMKLSII